MVQPQKSPEILHRFDFEAMGTDISVIVDCSPDFSYLIGAIEPKFHTWEKIFSRFIASSELSRLNQAKGKSFMASNEFAEVLTIAQLAETFSGGIVNFTMLDQIIAAGYTQDFRSLNGTHVSFDNHPWFAVHSVHEIEIDKVNKMVTMPFDMQVDLGGIVKGWAAQQAATSLIEIGPALVNAGGDLYATGPQRDGSLWQVSIERPYGEGEPIANFGIGKGAVATSGIYRRRWEVNGNSRHHLIDPRTGTSAQTDLAAATVIADNGYIAETAAKTILIKGSHEGMEWAEQHEVPAFIVLDDGTVQYNPAMQRFFWS